MLQALFSVLGPPLCLPAAACPVHGQGCSPLLDKPDTSRIVGIYLTEAGIMFHSGMYQPLVGEVRPAVVSDGSGSFATGG